VKKANLLLSALISLALMAPSSLVFAQKEVDLGVESSGLLPSNPFYFLKEFGRGVRKFFVGNLVRKAELELGILNEKAAELKKLQEITPDNISALSRAVANYQSAVEQYKIRLESLAGQSMNPNLDRLLTQIVERSLKHQQLFNALRIQFSSEPKFLENLDNAENALVEMLSVIVQRLDTPEKFHGRFESAIGEQKDVFKELKAAELADRLEEKLSGAAGSGVAALKEDLLVTFSGRLEGLQLSNVIDTEALEEVLGDRLRVLKLLDEVRELVVNPELKSELNILRQRLLEKVEETNGIGAPEAAQSISAARELLAEVEGKIAESQIAVSSAIRQLVERAKFNLSQAEVFYDEENYGSAFGQATAASAAAKNAWLQLASTAVTRAHDLDSLKQKYDQLIVVANDAGLVAENSPELFKLLNEAEKKIVSVARLIESKARPEAIANAIRNVKMLLATIEQYIATANAVRGNP